MVFVLPPGPITPLRSPSRQVSAGWLAGTAPVWWPSLRSGQPEGGHCRQNPYPLPPLCSTLLASLV